MCAHPAVAFDRTAGRASFYVRQSRVAAGSPFMAWGGGLCVIWSRGAQSRGVARQRRRQFVQAGGDWGDLAMDCGRRFGVFLFEREEERKKASGMTPLDYQPLQIASPETDRESVCVRAGACVNLFFFFKKKIWYAHVEVVTQRNGSSKFGVAVGCRLRSLVIAGD